MSLINRTIIIVLDSLGIGYLPDAKLFGDEGSNTLLHIRENVSDFYLPNLEKLGLGNIDEVPGLVPAKTPLCYYGKMAESSPGKDTTTGHFELMGNILSRPLPTYPKGFPKDIITEFEDRIRRSTLGNIPASGTKIINQLGDEHVKSGKPIVYTSADSVFQVAAHEEVISLEELYHICQIARDMLIDEHAVGRVIARPFKGESGSYYRTEARKDFSLEPPDNNLLTLASKVGYQVIGIGKIDDIFSGKGLTSSIHTKGNTAGIKETISVINNGSDKGIVMTNLVDFDMLYGHRNDSVGYYNALKEFDNYIPELLDGLKTSDLMIITADHGCDPGFPGTDHTREYVPILIYGKQLQSPTRTIGLRETFADVGMTAADLLEIGETQNGTSFRTELGL